MSDIDSLVRDLLSALPVVSDSESDTDEMAEFRYDMFKSALDNIKPYDGDVNQLNKFLTRCENFITKYNTFNDNELKQHVFQCIQEKLTGKAEIMVGRRMELDTWDKLKNALIQCFSDRRDIDCLVQELTRVRPHKSENLINFGNRLQLLVSNVIQRISNDQTLNLLQKNCQIDHYNKTALNSFIAGCAGNLRNNMYLKKPTTLEDAIAYVNEYENFEKLYGNFHDPLDKQKSNVVMPRNPNNFNNYSGNKYNQRPFQNQPQYQQFFRQQPFNPNPNFAPRPSWPSQPINIQPRQMPNQRYPTNNQVFGPPRNVFRPNQIPANQLPKPEPMSTTSRNPSFRTNRTNFEPRKPPNYTFEELYNKEINENEEAFTPNFHDEYDYYEDPSLNNYDPYYNTGENEIPENSNEQQNSSENANFQETSPDNPVT